MGAGPKPKHGCRKQNMSEGDNGADQLGAGATARRRQGAVEREPGLLLTDPNSFSCALVRISL